jgi:hypothetical protein
MGDPVSERSLYLAVRGDLTGDLFLIESGRVQHMGLLGAVCRRAPRTARTDEAAPMPTLLRAVRRAIACGLAIILGVRGLIAGIFHR